jgi:hypothetical protein
MGYCSPGSEKGWFKPGQKPPNTVPIGAERITADGYVEVKISDRPGSPRNRWRGKHTLIWEKANGQIPKGHVILFADGDRRNLKLNNLILVSRKELAVINHLGLLSTNKSVSQTGVIIAKLKILMKDRKRGTWKSRKNKLVVFDNNGKRLFIAFDSKNKRYVPARETKHGVMMLRSANLKPRKTVEEARKDLAEYAQKRGWFRL